MLLSQDVLMRALERDDLPDLQRWWNDAELTTLVGARRHLTSFEETEGWFEGHLSRIEPHSGRTYAIAHRREDRLLGTAWYGPFDPQDRNVEVGLYLGAEADRGKGLGTQALGVLLDYLFGDLNVHKVRLLVEAGNARAIRCYDKLGFRKEGVLRDHRYFGGRYHDFVAMGVLAGERPPS